MATDYIISEDKSKLDIPLIHNYLTNSYWAKGRSLATVETSIDNSLCFGVYNHGRQVGFARVVTDYSVFAWIMDVFVLEEHQGKGLGKLMTDSIMKHNQLQDLQRWGLNTFDAHTLYERYGFKELIKPEVHMELLSKPS